MVFQFATKPEQPRLPSFICLEAMCIWTHSYNQTNEKTKKIVSLVSTGTQLLNELN